MSPARSRCAHRYIRVVSAVVCGRPVCISALLDRQTMAMPTASPVWASHAGLLARLLPAAQLRCKWSRPHADAEDLVEYADAARRAQQIVQLEETLA